MKDSAVTGSTSDTPEICDFSLRDYLESISGGPCGELGTRFYVYEYDVLAWLLSSDSFHVRCDRHAIVGLTHWKGYCYEEWVVMKIMAL